MGNNRVYLIDGRKPSYKANLHCHSTISDGVMTPEELKAQYKGQGYQILAYTDHEVLVPHNDLTDEDFLAVTGYEAQFFGDLDLPKALRRVCHINFYSKDAHNCIMPFYNHEDVMRLDKLPDISKAFYEGDGKEPKEYSAEGLNRLIAKARAAGFIATYNHPTWSKESRDIYAGIEGVFAMEIYNHGTAITYDAYCPYIYEEMLRSGQRIGCVATDDTHAPRDLFGGFTMVQADALAYDAVMGALERGDYYASRGPIIHNLWYEDGVFHIDCSPAAKIMVANSGRRPVSLSLAESADGTLTHAEFPLHEWDVFVRFTVEDTAGKTANTRGYWREEFEASPASATNIRR